MPRRSSPDALAAAVGNRIRLLREEAGLTLEKLAYESDLGSKGHLSSLERGLVVPTVTTLATLARGLGVHLLDLVTFPEAGERERLVALTLRLSRTELVSLRKSIERRLQKRVGAVTVTSGAQQRSRGSYTQGGRSRTSHSQAIHEPLRPGYGPSRPPGKE
jgi:transcriptional regulator with XRE-family HTH domain